MLVAEDAQAALLEARMTFGGELAMVCGVLRRVVKTSICAEIDLQSSCKCLFSSLFTFASARDVCLSPVSRSLE